MSEQECPVEEQESAPEERAGFPAEWGPPPGAPFSDKRAAWVRECVLRFAPQAEIRRRDAARRLAVTRLAQLVARREHPCEP